MAYSFMTPIIAWLPPGFDCTIVMPSSLLAPLVTPEGGRAERFWAVYANGEEAASGSDLMEFHGGRLVEGPADDVVSLASQLPDLPVDGAYMEFGMRAVDHRPLFTNKTLPSLYNTYAAPGRKGFFTCHAWKFGVPHIINQIARFGRYIDACPHIHIDRARDIGESLVLINPYQQPILARLVTHDGLQPPRQRIPARSVKRVFLDDLLKSGEDEWIGHLQLTANNRLVTYMVKHALSDPGAITTVEHLDPFRANPTHAPLSSWLRLAYGRRRRRRRVLKGST